MQAENIKRIQFSLGTNLVMLCDLSCTGKWNGGSLWGPVNISPKIGEAVSISRARRHGTDCAPGGRGRRCPLSPRRGLCPAPQQGRPGGSRPSRVYSQPGVQGSRAQGSPHLTWTADPGCWFQHSLGRKPPPGRSRLHTPNLAQDTVGRRGLGFPDEALAARTPQAEGGGSRRAQGSWEGPWAWGRGHGKPGAGRGGEHGEAEPGSGAELGPRGGPREA